MALALVITYPVNNQVDVSSTLWYDSLTVKAATIDFTLVDPVAIPLVNYPTQIAALGFLGQLVSVETHEITDLQHNSHVFVTCSATPLTPSVIPAGGGLSQVLSDQVVTVLDDYLLEDGSGHYLLESGSLTDPGAFQMEGGKNGYQGLSVRTQVNGVTLPLGVVTLGGGPTLTYPGTSTLGSLTTFQGGLWPGIQFTLTSLNQGYSGTLFTVTDVAITYQAGQPRWQVFFGLTAADQLWTLNRWTKAVSSGA